MSSYENSNDEKRLNPLNDEKPPIPIPPTRRSKRMARKIPGKVHKPHRSRLAQQRLPSRNTSSVNVKTVSPLRRNNAFYQGTVVGSFLGATLSTVITTVVAKLIG
ncbi:PRM3 (YPL192C) [Zygosaccharomyces parabailii]|nr:PRM3 (YPL192C) [Zygosaccharomyces parabailii]